MSDSDPETSVTRDFKVSKQKGQDSCCSTIPAESRALSSSNIACFAENTTENREKNCKKMRASNQPQNKAKAGRTSTILPQPVQACIESLLVPYPEIAGRVRQAIQSPPELKPVQDSFLSTEELGDLLHVSRPTIFRYMRAGKITPHKLGRRNLYSVAEVMAAVKGGNE